MKKPILVILAVALIGIAIAVFGPADEVRPPTGLNYN